MSSTAIALPAAQSSLLSDVLVLSASVRAVWARPPRTSVGEIAEEIQETLRVLENARHAFVGLETKVRANLAGVLGFVDVPDAFPRALTVQFIAEVETMLATVPADVPEAHPFERLLKHVIEPYNDALRQYRRALQDYHAGLSRLLAAIDARDAEDSSLVRAVLEDEADEVVPWQPARTSITG